MWKRIRDHLSLLADIIQVAQPLSSLIAGAVAVATWVLSSIVTTRLEVVVPAVLVCGGAVLWLVTKLRMRWGWLPMPLGARLAYEELRDTVSAGMARRIGKGDPLEVLDFFAIAIANETGARVRGVRPPSRVHEEIPTAVFKAGTVTGGGRDLVFWENPGATYTELRVRAVDVRATIRRLREGDKLIGGRS